MPQPSPCVLIVDDDPDIRRFLSFLIEDAGFAVNTASDGVMALDAIKSQPPHLVLLDLQMPGMLGQEVLEQMRIEGIPVPVVFMSAGVRAQQEARRCGADGYLPKPFDLDAVVRVVGRFCENQHGGAPA